MFCARCNNFTTNVEYDGKSKISCPSCKYEEDQDQVILTSSIPLQLNQRNTSTEVSESSKRNIENLSYNPIIPISKDKICNECKAYCKYYIDPKTDLFVYACSKCHKWVK